jgi:phytoene dehydrogenase-like protein
MNSKEDIIAVVGGGVAGLAAATYLARSGKEVHVFEQSHSLGGRAQTKYHEGFSLNMGPHALYRGAKGIEVLRELGIEPRGSVPSVSGAFAVRDGIKHTFPAGAVSLLTTSLFGLSAKLEAGRLLAGLSKIDPAGLMSTTVRDWLDGNIEHEEVKAFMLAAFRVATYTNAPDLMSAGAAIEQLQKAQDQSVLYLDEGWQMLVDQLRDIAAGVGVTIETESRVIAVTRNATGEVNGVRLADGRQLDTSNVLIASAPSLVESIVEDASKTSLARFAEEAIPVRAACLDVALRNLPSPKSTFALGIDQPLYFSVHSAAAKLAPEGCALIQTAKYLTPDSRERPEDVEAQLEKLLDLIQPRWRDVVVYRRFLPDMIVMNSMPLASLGGTNGRPSPEVRDVPGLFLAGDWVGDEGMLVDAALASARKAAMAIIGAESNIVAVSAQGF